VDEHRPDPRWVAPETTVGGLPRPSPPTIIVRDDEVVDAPPTPVALRPLTVSDVLDGAFAILRAQPAKVVLIAALFAVPIDLVSAFLQRGVLGGVGFASLFTADPGSEAFAAAEDDGGAGPVVASLLSYVGPSLVLPFIAAALAVLVAGWYGGRDITVGQALSAAGRSWWALLASWFLVHLLEGLAALACFVPMFFLMPMYVCVAPAIAIEGLGPIQAMRRSWRLAKRRYWATFGVALLTGVVASTLASVLPILPSTLALIIGLDWGWILLGVGTALTSLIVLPVVAGSAVLIYLDLRIRTEGLDLELDAQRAFGQLATR
jgi:hypothetical protein